jgi:hypothetical protein
MGAAGHWVTRLHFVLTASSSQKAQRPLNREELQETFSSWTNLMSQAHCHWSWISVCLEQNDQSIWVSNSPRVPLDQLHHCHLGTVKKVSLQVLPNIYGIRNCRDRASNLGFIKHSLWLWYVFKFESQCFSLPPCLISVGLLPHTLFYLTWSFSYQTLLSELRRDWPKLYILPFTEIRG